MPQIHIKQNLYKLLQPKNQETLYIIKENTCPTKIVFTRKKPENLEIHHETIIREITTFKHTNILGIHVEDAIEKNYYVFNAPKKIIPKGLTQCYQKNLIEDELYAIIR